MFIASAFVTFLLAAVLYLSETRWSAVVFAGLTAGFAAVNIMALPSRKDIWDYLVRHTYDGVLSYSHIQYYDKAMGIFCGFAAAVSAAAILSRLAESDFVDRTADAVVLLVMVSMGLVYIILAVTNISKYYDASELYTAPFIKGEIILLLSFTIRKITGTNKASV